MLKDTDPMPFGMHKGTQMQDVPASHLMYLYDNDKLPKGSDVCNYVLDRMGDLRIEAANEKKGIFKSKNAAYYATEDDSE
jgi:uncharacterized protein (DUF3820 family)